MKAAVACPLRARSGRDHGHWRTWVATCQLTLAGEAIDAVARTSRQIVSSPHQPGEGTFAGGKPAP